MPQLRIEIDFPENTDYHNIMGEIYFPNNTLSPKWKIDKMCSQGCPLTIHQGNTPKQYVEVFF